MKRRLQVFRSPLNVLPLIFLMIIHVGANADAKDSSQNDRKIKYNLENATLEEAFQDIENKTQLRFSFDDQVIDKNVRITFKGKADLEEVLKVISRDAELQFKRINENVHVKKRYVVPKTSGSSTKRVQGSTVSGKVTDESGAGLPGATVKVQGTSTGTITDLDGNFSIVVEPDAVLEVSFIGYVTKTIVVGGRSTVDVGMDLDIQALSEVVVIGYGTRDERDVVGAISSISTDEIAQSMAALTPEMAMQGRMAGVFVSNPGGDPTARPEIRIRGVGSFNNNDPLYVIDGVPVVEFGSIPVAGVDQARAEDIRGSVNIMNMINPADIESISVLKDATAAAIYGSRAANGVILITTKNGQAGKPKVTFSAQYGVKNVTDTYDVLNTPQYTSYLTDAYNNSNQTLPFYLDPSDAGYLGNSQSDDWQDALINDNAVSENYSVNVSGGNDFSTYYIGVAYANEEASLKFNETERYTVTLNSDHQVTPWLKVGQTARLAYMDVLQNRSNGTFEDLTRIPAWQPVYDANGDPARILERVDDGSGGIADSLFYGLVTARNPIGVNETQRFGTEFWRFLGSAYVEVEPIKDLKIRGGVSYDWNLNQRTQFIGFDRRFFRTGGNPSAGSDFSQRDSRTTNLLKDITISYNKAFGDHRLDVVLNASEQSTLASGVSAESFEIPADSEEEFLFVADGDGGVAGWREETGLVGYVGRLSYNYQAKYYLDVAVRRDASSNFAEDFRWGTFPSISGAWRISAESFMDGLSFLDDLKIRGGWGQLGNQNVTPFSYLATINFNPKYGTGSIGDGTGVGGQLNSASFVGVFPTRDLSWETTTTISVGLEGALLNNMVQFGIEYYDRKTTDILQNVSLPQVTGAPGEVPFNIGEMSNKGIELNFNVTKTFGDFTVNVGGNLTTVNNEVLKRFDGVAATDGSERIEEGESFRYIYGFKTDGIYQNQAEIDADNQQYSENPNTAPGDIRFQNINSSSADGGILPGPDSLLNQADRTFLGKTIAGHYYGLNLGVNYKNFDLTIFFRGVGDVQRINEIRELGESMTSEHNQLRSTLGRWTGEGTSNSIPRAIIGDPAGNNRTSDRWVEDAGFLRLQTLRLGYTLPTNVINKIGASSFRVYTGFDNLFVVSDYSGVDPENDRNPLPRTFLVGLTASF